VDKIIWFYDEYCSRHPRLTEFLLVCVAVAIVHVGLTFVKDAAARKGLENSVITGQPPKATLPSIDISSRTATTKAPRSPAIAGDGNTVQYDSPDKKD
jgi:hypothetical protein